jgi:hypothetical protein
MDNSQAGSRLGNFLRLRGAITDSGLFDARWYRRHSKAARLWPSPLLHYLVRGWRQGLDPSPDFDTSFYLERYRDVRGSQANPLMHYVLHGKEEGRLATQSGAIFRESLHPELAPLPIFAVPGTPGSRLSVVIDDYTPTLLGLGYTPLLALAAQTASAAGWSLRVVLRSTEIPTTEISAALQAVMPEKRPLLDIARREPGHTDDVDTVEGEHWWASSITSYHSLSRLVPPRDLHWVLTAHEPQRLAAGERRLLAEQALSSPHTRTIVVGGAVDASDIAGEQTRIDTLPALMPHSSQTKTGSRLGVIVDQASPESLVARSVQVIDECLARGVLDDNVNDDGVNDDTVDVVFLGLDVAPVSLLGSRRVVQQALSTPQQWATALGSVDHAVLLRAGTEGSLLRGQLDAQGISSVDATPHTSPSAGDIDGVVDAVSALLAGTTHPSPPAASWDDVTASVVASMGGRA